MTDRVVGHGFVNAEGQLKLDERSRFTAGVKGFAGKRVTLTVEDYKSQRSLAQNARFWKICTLVAEAWSVGRELPISKDQAKLVLCKVFLGQDETPLGPVPKGTSGLSVEEMGHLMTAIESHFASEGQPLPLEGY